MPWKARSPMDERMAFMTRLQAGESMAELCREFGVSRKTGYKLKGRYERYGPQGLLDRSRAPRRQAHRTPSEVEELFVRLRKQHPTWGSKKLLAVLQRRRPGVRLPARSTVDEILRRHGLVVARQRRRGHAVCSLQLQDSEQPNDLWCADFKGQFRMGNRKYCYPLTLTDHHSRFLLSCYGLHSTQGESARDVFDEAFRQYGLPARIRTDNGAPFASTGLAGLSKLSVWWMKLGIVLERIEPGQPQQNGRHERMHRTLKAETTRPAGANILQQQERFDRFVLEYNHERPHEALQMHRPAECYAASCRPYSGETPEPKYPLHDDVRRVFSCGHLHMGNRGKRVYLSTALAGELVGIREEHDGRWTVTFIDTDLGHVDNTQTHFHPAEVFDQGASSSQNHYKPSPM